MPDLERLIFLESAFPTDRMSARQMRSHLGSPSASLRVLDTDLGIAGYSLTFFRASSAGARLYSIAVSPDRQGLGLGRRLLLDVEETASTRGSRWLSLEVRADNPPAISLYERSGYLRTGRRERYYSDGAAALTYRKSLAP